MINYSIVQKSHLEGATRLDAEYYHPEYLTYLDKIRKFSKPLAEFVKLIKHPAEIERIYEESGVPFLLTQNISPDLYILQFDEKRFIREEDAKKIPQNKLLAGDTVMTRTGANYGDAAVYLGDPSELFASAHILIIRPKNVTGEFLATFLNSKIGRALVKRGVYGTSQPEISPEYIKTLLIPFPNEKKLNLITENVRLAHRALKDSKSLYSQAEDYFSESLGLKDFEPEKELSYVINLSEVKSAHRADAEYFKPKYQRLLKFLGKEKQPLKMIAKRKTAKRKILADCDYKYIEISDVDVGSGDVSFNILKGSNLPANAKIKIEGGELIVSKVRPTRGAVGIIPNDWNSNFMASGAFSVFQVPSPTREYLQVVLRSIVGKLQMEKPTTGTSYPTVIDEDIEELIIPILPQSAQERIAKLVLQSHKARRKANELLEKAKREVEEFIEKR